MSFSFSFSFMFGADENMLDESEWPAPNVRPRALTFQPSLSSVASLSIEDLHKEIRKVVAETPMSPIKEEVEETDDLFDNPFIPYTPVPFIDGEIDVKLSSNETDPIKLAWKIAKWQQQPSKSDVSKIPFVWPPMAEGHVEPTHRLIYPTMDEFLDDREPQSDCDSCYSYDAAGSASTPATTPSPRTIAPLPKSPPSSRCSLRSTSSLPSSPTRARSFEDGDYMPASALKKRKAKQPMEKPASKKIAFETEGLLKAPKGLPATRTVSREAESSHAADKHEELRAPPSSNTWVRCPFDDCSHKCRAPGDMQRHVQSAKHQKPSIPCPRGCGDIFTRVDAAKRHANGKRCKARR